ncbi:response regulator [Salinisphaera sp. SPP-AMP-43]|uniref:response regulator n=1 Tax=Salinisphaera sp. SPP-AMP-43 TaxID=3121288 RepID=UPI003C6E4E46
MERQDNAMGLWARWLSGISIRRQLIGAVALILLLFGASCVIALIALDSVNRARISASQTHALLVRSQALGEAITAQESALRGYVLTAEQRYEDQMRAANADVEDNLHRLQDASASDQERAGLLNQIDELESGWQRTVAEPVLARVDTGSLDTARNTLVTGASVAYFDPIHAALEDYRARLKQDLAARDASAAERQWNADATVIGLLVTGLLIGTITIIGVRRRIATPLLRLTDTTRRLAGGERNVQVRYQARSDEIGDVSRALETFRQMIVRQDRDYWIRDHRGRVTSMLYQCADDRALGRTLLDELAPLLHVGYAAVFTRELLEDDEADFVLLAAYGYSPEAGKRFAPGEGLVGAALKMHRPVELDNVPDGYIPIQSGLGQAQPRIILVAPAIIAGQVVAIIELALFHPLTETERGLLDALLPNIGMAVLTQMRTRRATELLEQSREQTRQLTGSQAQLSAQQADLKQANSELHAKSEELAAQTAELRASEEELKSQADELQAANTHLRENQQELAALHAEAEERAEELERASAYKSDFLANMSHELRTPLNSLLILSRSLADNETGNLDDEQVEAARIIHDSGTGLLYLINDILDLSKIEAGKMRILPERVALADFAERIRRQFSHMAEAQDLGFEVCLEDAAPAMLVTDGGKLEQIVRNLVSNAIKFTRQGCIRVVFERPSPEVEWSIDGLTADNALAIHVCDEGIGIPRERLDDVFKAFEQIDGSSTRNYGGTGLGLSITRELAQLLGGEVQAESTLGQGSCFTVYVRTDLAEPAGHSDSPSASQAEPLAVAANDAVPVRRRSAASTNTRQPQDALRVLVVDDDATFANIVCETARRRGFNAQAASDGETALRAIADCAPDAIILDLGLPGGLDGWAVLDRIKAEPNTREIPVHIVSAADDIGRSSSAGAVGYLCKPVTRDNLETLLARAEVLSGRKTRRVLVVDDDADAHAAITQMLRREQVDTVLADSGAAALEQLEAATFDCLILDLKLPDISGFDLLDRIAERADAPPVVVYSGRDLSAEETQRLRGHTDSIVIKGHHAHDRLLDEVSLFMHRLGPPAAVEAPTPSASDSAADDSILSAKRVLLVDDDMRNTFALSRILRGKGMQVVMAADGFKALERMAAAETLDLVLMDIMMPEMDGFETIRRIRAGQNHGQVPIIALTAKAMNGDREACLAAGADAYLSKPIDTDALVERMQAVLS